MVQGPRKHREKFTVDQDQTRKGGWKAVLKTQGLPWINLRPPPVPCPVPIPDSIEELGFRQRPPLHLQTLERGGPMPHEVDGEGWRMGQALHSLRA